MSVLDEMKRLDIPRDTVTYNTLIAVHGKGSKWREAMALLQEMQLYGIPCDEISFNTAIDACDKAGQWVKALRLLRQMIYRSGRPLVLCR